MKILMLTWEYPPRSVGGLAQHVYDLSTNLSAQGETVTVVTCGDSKTKPVETVNGVKVIRVNPYNLKALDFTSWVMQLNFSMLENCIQLVNAELDFDLVHVHDWLAAYAGRVLKHAYHLPVIATVHATEYGRNQGLHSELQRYISDVEWWLCYEAWRVICCSQYMKNELQRVFQVPDDKIRVVPNGVDPAGLGGMVSLEFKREHYAASDEKIVFYVGRLVREKGVHVLLHAVPRILLHYPRTKFVIAGRGPSEEYLKNLAKDLGISNRVYFTGYIEDEIRNALYQAADVAVFPSLYEPFGMVALEAMAALTPIVVSDTGGLAEVVKHGVNGLKAYSGQAESLAHNILLLLQDEVLAERLAEKAKKDIVNQYSWREIAEKTAKVYQSVRLDYENSLWKSDSWLVKVNKNREGIPQLDRYFRDKEAVE